MKVLNNRRYVEVRALLEKCGISLSEEYYECLANVFEIISVFVNGKLSNQEILRAYDLLSDVMKNDRPDIVAYVSKEDRIRVAVRLMEELPETKGKLTDDEKIAFAFCILTGECTQIFDEESGQIRSGVVLFDTFEHIESELLYATASDPDRFDLKKSSLIIDERYGYSVETAIHVTSIPAAYAYLERLKYGGQTIMYDRIGSFVNSVGNHVAGYRIYTQKSGLFSKKKTEVATLYINSYCLDMPSIAPKGFTLI